MPTWAGLAEDGAQAGQDSSALTNTFLNLFWPLRSSCFGDAVSKMQELQLLCSQQ